MVVDSAGTGIHDRRCDGFRSAHGRIDRRRRAQHAVRRLDRLERTRHHTCILGGVEAELGWCKRDVFAVHGWWVVGAGIADGSLFTKKIGLLLGEIEGTGGGSTHNDGARTAQLLATLRAHSQLTIRASGSAAEREARGTALPGATFDKVKLQRGDRFGNASPHSYRRLRPSSMIRSSTLTRNSQPHWIFHASSSTRPVDFAAAHDFPYSAEPQSHGAMSVSQDGSHLDSR